MLIHLDRINYKTHLQGILKVDRLEIITMNHSFGGKYEPMPDGIWEIVLRKELSDMTKEWRKKNPWFTWFLMLKNVPNRKWLYFHSGNQLKNSKGCELTGLSIEGGYLYDSLEAMEKLYTLMYRILEVERVLIDIKTVN